MIPLVASYYMYFSNRIFEKCHTLAFLNIRVKSFSINPSKFLGSGAFGAVFKGHEIQTSLMTSNVGTLAFKAPEFFQRKVLAR